MGSLTVKQSVSRLDIQKVVHFEGALCTILRYERSVRFLEKITEMSEKIAGGKYCVGSH